MILYSFKLEFDENNSAVEDMVVLEKCVGQFYYALINTSIL